MRRNSDLQQDVWTIGDPLNLLSFSHVSNKGCCWVHIYIYILCISFFHIVILYTIHIIYKYKYIYMYICMIYITITYMHIYLCYISNDFYNSYVLINYIPQSSVGSQWHLPPASWRATGCSLPCFISWPFLGRPRQQWSIAVIVGVSFGQWEFQDPKMEVLTVPYKAGIFSRDIPWNLGLKNRPLIW